MGGWAGADSNDMIYEKDKFSKPERMLLNSTIIIRLKSVAVCRKCKTKLDKKGR